MDFDFVDERELGDSDYECDDGEDRDLDSMEIDYPSDDEEYESEISQHKFLDKLHQHETHFHLPLTRLICPSFEKKECQLCFNTGDALICKNTGRVESISNLYRYDLSSMLHSNDYLRSDIILSAPCTNQSHIYCMNCLRNLVSKCLETILVANSGLFPCPS